jgi:N-acetylmuramoyl-L-alanine amidase
MHYRRAATALAALLAACAVLPAAWGQTGDTGRKPAAACDRANFHLVVDVGHTLNGGARSARGLAEYDYNLRLATEIVQALTVDGFAKTTLLVSEDSKRAALFKRAEHANGLKADLFLSIHHDSVPLKFIEKWEFEGEQHGFSDRFRGHSIFISNDNPEHRGSLLFGRLLGNALKARGLQYAAHYTEPFMGNRRRELVDKAAGVYRFDHLIVLRQTRMPAVLLEAGSIIHRDEELEMRVPERRAVIIAAVAESVADFCAQRGRSSEAVTARHRTTAKPKTPKQ